MLGLWTCYVVPVRAVQPVLIKQVSGVTAQLCFLSSHYGQPPSLESIGSWGSGETQTWGLPEKHVWARVLTRLLPRSYMSLTTCSMSDAICLGFLLMSSAVVHGSQSHCAQVITLTDVSAHTSLAAGVWGIPCLGPLEKK